MLGIKGELQAVAKQMEELMSAGKQDEIINFYTDDCRVLSPGVPMMVGKEGMLFITC